MSFVYFPHTNVRGQHEEGGEVENVSVKDVLGQSQRYIGYAVVALDKSIFLFLKIT